VDDTGPPRRAYGGPEHQDTKEVLHHPRGSVMITGFVHWRIDCGPCGD
jgi:hypothetical protein